MTYELNKTRRPGKTERDRESGALQRNISNKRARADWQASSNSRTPTPFPTTSCNGKKNRHRWMDKEANYVVKT